jgi:hypothetical protein
MEQRPLRLGDVVDDYCPRERRVTNHAIVAIVEDVIRQTRCTTCDAEHPFKGAREPRLRKKPSQATLYDQVLAEVAGTPAAETAGMSASAPDPEPPGPAAVDGSSAETAGDPGEPQRPPHEEDRAADGWLAHRQLIRATLPRTDSEPTPRPIPEFTMHQRQTRGGRPFRYFGGNGNEANGNGPGRPGRHGKHRRRGHKRPR